MSNNWLSHKNCYCYLKTVEAGDRDADTESVSYPRVLSILFLQWTVGTVPMESRWSNTDTLWPPRSHSSLLLRPSINTPSWITSEWQLSLNVSVRVQHFHYSIGIPLGGNGQICRIEMQVVWFPPSVMCINLSETWPLADILLSGHLLLQGSSRAKSYTTACMFFCTNAHTLKASLNEYFHP